MTLWCSVGHCFTRRARQVRLPTYYQYRWQYRCFAALGEEREPTYASTSLTGFKIFQKETPFVLQAGGELVELKIAYETWGNLNSRRDNTILLQCGMSASSHACSHPLNSSPGWWEDYIGPGKPLDTNLFFIVCTNNLGGCYGTTGPSSLDPGTGKPYGGRFPRFTVQDMVAAQFLVLDYLEIDTVHAAVGASLGGMQSVCAAALYPERVRKFVSISACAKSSPSSMAFRHTARRAIMSDPNWNGGDYYDGPLPAAGLRLAREIGTITYRSGSEWQERFGQKQFKADASEEPQIPDGLQPEWEIERYLSHQGHKWVDQYDPNSFIFISKAMDGFSLEKVDEATGKPSLVAGLAKAQQPALIIGVQHDVLFPVWQQKQMADTLRAAGNRRVAYYELDSVYGHDTFLLAQESIGPAVKGLLEQEPYGAAHLWEDLAGNAARVVRILTEKNASEASMREIFHALGPDESGEVSTVQLRSMVGLIWGDKLQESEIDQIFAEGLGARANVSQRDFLSLRSKLIQQTHDVYLP